MGIYRRFFALPSELIGDKIFLQSEYHHIAKVLRSKVGDLVIVTLGDGIDYMSKITEINADTVVLDIISAEKNPNESAADVTLFQGVIKGGAMDWAVEKAVELGVNSIVPFISDFTVAECNQSKAERLTKIAHEASKQCGRARLVDVSVAVKFDKLPEMLKNFDQILFCYERGGKQLKTILNPNAKKIAIVVGSEGGFGIGEAQMISDLDKVVTVSLGGRILRAETAGIYALSVIDGIINDYDYEK